jgi:hypothetical protein
MRDRARSEPCFRAPRSAQRTVFCGPAFSSTNRGRARSGTGRAGFRGRGSAGLAAPRERETESEREGEKERERQHLLRHADDEALRKVLVRRVPQPFLGGLVGKARQRRAAQRDLWRTRGLLGLCAHGRCSQSKMKAGATRRGPRNTADADGCGARGEETR